MSKVKIRDVRVIMTQPPRGGRFTVVKIETTEPGLYGLGDASYRTRPLAVRSAIADYLRPFLIGKDVANIEDIWQSAYVSSYWRNGPVLNNALGGVDEALWDIKGKMAGMPVYDVLGGKAREAAAVYAHASGGSLEETEARAFKLLAEGFHHIRLQTATPGFDTYGSRSGGQRDPYDGPRWIATQAEPASQEHAWAQRAGIFEPMPYMRSALAMMAHMRNKMGWKVEFLHDAHERLPAIQAVQFAKEMEPFKLFFMEDLFAPGQVDWFRRVREQCATPLAMGEIINNPLEIAPLVDERLIDFIRLRVAHIGGITPARKYAAHAEMYGVRTAWQGPGNISPVGVAAHLHLDLTASNFGIQESPEHHPGLAEIFPGMPEIRDGYMWANDEPGLGVDIDEAAALKFPHHPTPGGMFDNVRRADGSVVTP